MAVMFVLDGLGRPVEAEDADEVYRFMQGYDCQVGVEVRGSVAVSTQFLGINLNMHPRGRPLVFETMVFGGPYDRETRQYETLEEAKAGHAQMVEKVFGKVGCYPQSMGQ